MNARRIFVVCLFLALPGVLWQAFEMYGLTLGGAQMLFFSIVHTMPPLVLLVLLAVPSVVVLLIQSVTALFAVQYRSKIGISKSALTVLSVFLVAHSAALLSYDTWSHIQSVRTPICILGIVLLAISIVFTVVSFVTASVAQEE